MLSMLAAERYGYMGRPECLARLWGMLDIIGTLGRHHGFFCDKYDLATGKPKKSQLCFRAGGSTRWRF